MLNNITFDIYLMFESLVGIRNVAFKKSHTQRCFQEKVCWKYATNLQENTRAEKRFQ